jgi:hypothetical protein
MRVIQENIGDTTILIQAIDDELEVVGEEGRATRPTGVDESVKRFYKKLKSNITGIAKDVSTDMRRIGAEDRPRNLEIEFNVGVSAEAGPVFLVGGGNAGVKIKMVWDFE